MCLKGVSDMFGFSYKKIINISQHFLACDVLCSTCATSGSCLTCITDSNPAAQRTGVNCDCPMGYYSDLTVSTLSICKEILKRHRSSVLTARGK